MTLFKGSGVAIVTPFKNNRINFNKLGELLEWHIKEHIDATIICGTTGEAATMTDAEKVNTIRFTVDMVNKRIPVIAGTGSNNTQHTIDMSKKAEEVDVIIDFSRPEALVGLLAYAIKTKTPLIIATTGLSKKDLDKIMEGSADIEIVEKHHDLKIDATSGTAYLIANQIKSSLKIHRDYVLGRHSKTEKRSNNEIGIHAIRGGTIIGDHTVIFPGADEVFEISHRALSKNIFALGAIKAAKFIANKEPSFYNMDDLMQNYK
ncbi:MAG: dihydrodipicolinate synthase family protein [Tissierellales bacterium]